MTLKWWGFPVLCVALLPILSCAAGQKMVSLEVRPATVVFEGVGTQVQFSAIGTFIHPPSTKDVSDQVTWSIDVANLATITSTGLATGINICGKGNVIATADATLANAPPGTVMKAEAAISGIDDGKAPCPQ